MLFRGTLRWFNSLPTPTVYPMFTGGFNQAKLRQNDFEMVFRDSGAWDFFLLKLYDDVLRWTGVYSLFWFSEWSLVERISWNLSQLTNTLCSLKHQKPTNSPLQILYSVAIVLIVTCLVIVWLGLLSL